MTVLAADANGATGTGESIGHVDKEVTTVTLPTDTGVANVFNYYVDPERVIDLAGSLKDGTSVTKNADGVYFVNKGDSGNSYSSSSDAVEFEGKNSVDVDVSVAATVTAGAKDITLVADDAALAAATTPALLMNLKVGSETKAITSDGTTAKAKLAGKAENFEVKVDSGAYKYAAKDGATGWEKTTVQLSGKTNQKDVPSDMTAPTIALTWTIAKHVDSYVSASTVSASSNSVTLSLPSGVTLSKIELTHENGTGAIALTNGNQYTLSDTTCTFSAKDIPAWLNLNPAYSKLVLTFSDNKTETISIQ